MFILVRPRCLSGVDRAKAAFIGMSHSRSDSSPHSSSSYVALSSISLWRWHTCSTFSWWISPRRRISWRARQLSWTCISLWGQSRVEGLEGGGDWRESEHQWDTSEICGCLDGSRHSLDLLIKVCKSPAWGIYGLQKTDIILSDKPFF